MKRFYSILIAIIALLVAQAVPAKPPSWDTVINAKGRFTVLKQFNNEAVLDKETGLVWERSPDTGTRDWVNALLHCYQKQVGGRLGWRGPTIEELASLVDPNNPSGDPDLPPGHPFNDVQSSEYWSATTSPSSTSVALDMHFGLGIFSGGAGKAIPKFVWCVRGGQGIDGVQ